MSVSPKINALPPAGACGFNAVDLPLPPGRTEVRPTAHWPACRSGIALQPCLQLGRAQAQRIAPDANTVTYMRCNAPCAIAPYRKPRQPEPRRPALPRTQSLAVCSKPRTRRPGRLLRGTFPGATSMPLRLRATVIQLQREFSPQSRHFLLLRQKKASRGRMSRAPRPAGFGTGRASIARCRCCLDFSPARRITSGRGAHHRRYDPFKVITGALPPSMTMLSLPWVDTA